MKISVEYFNLKFKLYLSLKIGSFLSVKTSHNILAFYLEIDNFFKIHSQKHF